MEKTLFIFLLAVSFSCPSCEEKESEFEVWVDSLTWESAVQIKESANASFLEDIRTITPPTPFSYEDEIIEMGEESKNVPYPYTYSQGWTSVSYGDKEIFRQRWGRPVYERANMMSVALYGELAGTKCLLITNQDVYDDGSSSYIHRLFLERGESLEMIDLHQLGVTYSLWIGQVKEREGVLVMYSVDFVRVPNRQEHIILFDVSSGERKNFDYPFDL